MKNAIATTQATEYQGWTNYATWRINLEVLDGYISDISQDGEMQFACTADCADFLKDSVDEMLFTDAPDGLATDYAKAFVSDVNWFEIAEIALAEYPNLIKQD